MEELFTIKSNLLDLYSPQNNNFEENKLIIFKQIIKLLPELINSITQNEDQKYLQIDYIGFDKQTILEYLNNLKIDIQSLLHQDKMMLFEKLKELINKFTPRSIEIVEILKT